MLLSTIWPIQIGGSDLLICLLTSLSPDLFTRGTLARGFSQTACLPRFIGIFTPAEVWRLSQKLEVHDTPKHGSWLNRAEIELSVLARQCLHRRLAILEEVSQEVAAWQQERNQAQATIHRRFTAADARIKLKRLYPSIEV